MERTYTTAEICEVFNISKGTLFRYENEAWFPTVQRDRNDGRVYSSQHISAIANKLYRQSLRRKSGLTHEAQQEESFYSFLVWRDEWALRALGKSTLSPRIIKQLLRIALEDYQPIDMLFRGIIELIYNQLCLAAPSPERAAGSTEPREPVESVQDPASAFALT